ncbi:hypothetical protein QTN47_16980 [Danxiaibacter flavus]|uniref:Uncharacterized protein n=1 Tax=Danxiaibacter flavus TaxID=3049108 RepID=A0ABV3ZJE1_9BACT|nr:hypothetical protein QNM32_16990 [Chitinophagaceae bacterium DXS]
MNGTTLTLLALVLFCGCQKSIDPLENTVDLPQQAIDETTFSFKMNDSLIQWNGSLTENDTIGAALAKFTSKDPNYKSGYSIFARKVTQVDTVYRRDYLNLAVPGDSLNETTYTFQYRITKDFFPGDGKFWNISYSTWPGDFYTVTISKVHNGMADGTFSAKFTDDRYPIKKGQAVITEGKFTNLKVHK